MGSTGNTQNSIESRIETAKRGSDTLTYGEVTSIQREPIAIDTSKLSNDERARLAEMTYNEIKIDGATAVNSLRTVSDINNAKTANVALYGLNTSELSDFARMMNRINDKDSVEKALKIIQWYYT